MTTRRWLGGSANWTTAADWTGGVVPQAPDDVLIAQGAPQVGAPIAVHSLVDNGVLSFANAGGSSVAAGVNVGGVLAIDAAAGSGGSTLSVAGALTVTPAGQVTIGNATASSFTTVSVGTLSLRGALSLASASGGATYLNVQTVAGFGTAGVLSGHVTLSDSSVIRFQSGSISKLSFGASLQINGASAFLADSGATASNSALTGLTTIATQATLGLSDFASISDSASLVNYGALNIDAGAGEGSSTFYEAASLSNVGALQIGNATLSGFALAQTASFRNFGTVHLQGSATGRAVLNITTGTADDGALTGQISLAGSSLLEVASGQYTAIGYGASLHLDGASAYVAHAGAVFSNSALTGLEYSRGALALTGGASVAVTGPFVNYGEIQLGGDLDAVGATLSFASSLTNDGGISLTPGEAGGTVTLSAASLINHLYVDVGAFAGLPSGNAVLHVTGTAGFGAAGTVTGDVRITRGGVIDFDSGLIYDVRANGYLTLDDGYLAIGATMNANSALAQLRQNEGYFRVVDDSKVATSAAFSNSGDMSLENGGAFTTLAGFLNRGTTSVGEGDLESFSSTLTAASFNNQGSVTLAGEHNIYSTAALVVHSVAGTGTAGVLTGTVSLSGDTLLQFDNGQISSIQGKLSLESGYAHVADAGSVSTNSALMGLSSIYGALSLDNASVSVSVALTVIGELDLDPHTGGAALTITRQLDNEGVVRIGASTLTASDVLTAAALVNNGALTLTGAASNRATLVVHASAGFGVGGNVIGDVQLNNDALIQFDSGGIAKIRVDGRLTLDGADAFVARASDTTHNSALTGLQFVDGFLTLRDNATVVANGAIAVSGRLALDDAGSGGSVLSMGALDNEGQVFLGNSAMTSANDLAATRITNHGELYLTGSASTAELYVGSAAGFGVTGELTGDVELTNDALILFAAGGLTRIDGGSSLTLDGAAARIAVSGSAASNSALLTLAVIEGGLELEDGALVQSHATTLTNYGVVSLDRGGGGSTLIATGRIDNEGSLALGDQFLTISDQVSAASLLNEGAITLTGQGAAHAQLHVSGTTTNNGSITIASDAQTFSGAVAGSGTDYLQSGSRVEFDASVAATQKVAFGGADALVLGAATSFAAAISGFVASDTIDLKTFAAGSTLAYSGDTHSGVLTVTSGASVAHLNFNGAYTLASFAHGTDGSGGLLLSHT